MKEDITKIIFAIIMLVQIPVYFSYAYNQLPETIILENPNPIIHEVQAKIEPTPTPTVEEYVEQVFGDSAEGAKKVVACESSWRPNAKNPNSSAKGIFQVIDGTWKQFNCEGDVFNPYDSTNCAKKIYDYYGSFGTSGGWLASKNCWGR